MTIIRILELETQHIDVFLIPLRAVAAVEWAGNHCVATHGSAVLLGVPADHHTPTLAVYGPHVALLFVAWLFASRKTRTTSSARDLLGRATRGVFACLTQRERGFAETASTVNGAK